VIGWRIKCKKQDEIFEIMCAEDVKVDLEELKKFKEKNKKERLEFTDFWVDYIKTHSDKEWSEQQKDLIDSQVGGQLI